MRAPVATPREKKIWVAASSHTWGETIFSRYSVKGGKEWDGWEERRVKRERVEGERERGRKGERKDVKYI